jgi:hypothetical protein
MLCGYIAYQGLKNFVHAMRIDISQIVDEWLLYDVTAAFILFISHPCRCAECARRDLSVLCSG